jgi:DNA-binding NtrC family response regulator
LEQALVRPAPRPAQGQTLAPLATGPSQPGQQSEATPQGELPPSGANGMVGQPVAVSAIGPQPEQSFDLDRPLREARDAFEKSYFEFHLAKENGSMTRVAEKTGLERTHLYRKLKQLGVDLARSKRTGM